MTRVYYTELPSPIGPLLLAGDGTALTAIALPSPGGPLPPEPGWTRDPGPFAEATAQLEAYFAGALRDFDLPLAPGGTPFQQRVWAALREIPYGATASYAAVARRIGHPAAVRAVGAANGRNPIPIVIPCHRVIGGDGRLVGYGGGLAAKEALLALERGVARSGAVAIRAAPGGERDGAGRAVPVIREGAGDVRP